MPGAANFTSRVVEKFLTSRLSILLILATLAAGAVGFLKTPREEEPQIVVPMVDVIVPFPGASPTEVESQLVTPLERRLWGIPGVEYLYSSSRAHVGFITVRFRVNEPMEPSLVKVHQEVQAHPELFPAGTLPPTVRATDLSGLSLRGFDLSGLDLTGINFSGLDLSWAKFAGATNFNAEGVATLFGADLRGVSFAAGITKVLSGIELRFADLAGLDLSGFTFDGLNLKGIRLGDAIVRGASFASSLLQGLDLSSVKNLDFANLKGAFYDGLVLCAQEEVDTIVLLSHGVPSRGTYDRPGRLIDEFRRVNRFRRVAVETVLVGTQGADRTFMADLAEATGGRFEDAGRARR